MQAIFERKPSNFMPHEFEIAKTIQLPAAQFQSLLVAPLRDYDFIKEHADLMCCDEHNVFHCLLLTGEGRNDGLLVESEGYGYCRYAAYVPEVSALCSPALQRLNDQLTAAADYIVATGIQKTTNGEWRFSFEELDEKCGIWLDCEDIALDTIEHLLRERKEVLEASAYNGAFYITYQPEFCQSGVLLQEGQPTAPPQTLRELISTRWEDIHLMHKDVEVEPATIVELDANTLTEAGKEAWADVLSAEVSKIYTGYYGLQIELDKVKPRRLEEFSSMLAGYCSVQDYKKWVTEGAEAPSQSPEMKL